MKISSDDSNQDSSNLWPPLNRLLGLLSIILRNCVVKPKNIPGKGLEKATQSFDIVIDEKDSLFSTGENANLFYEFARLHDSQSIGPQIKTIIYKFITESMNNRKLVAKSSNINQDVGGIRETHANVVATISDIIKNATSMLVQLQNAIPFSNDPAFVNLARAICKVIYYYTYHSCDDSDPEVKKICIFTCDKLNEMNRDVVLFKCLEIPNDKLKMIIVKILNAVNPEQYEEAEQKRLWSILKEHKNVGAGKNEIVIGTIFLILTKIRQYIEDPAHKQIDATSNFIQTNYANFISIALEMLRKNMSRDLKEDAIEQREKNVLNLCIVVFLKAMTLGKGIIPPGIETTNNLDSISIVLRDESNLNPIDSEPAEVEKTIGCRNTKCK
jgi:hypothetical protein